VLGSNRKLPSAADLVRSTSVPLHAGHEVLYIITNSRMLVRSRNSLSSKCKGWVSVSPLRLTLNAFRRREQLTVNEALDSEVVLEQMLVSFKQEQAIGQCFKD